VGYGPGRTTSSILVLVRTLKRWGGMARVARLDPNDLNDDACERLADFIRAEVRRFERLGVADDPDMTYVAWAREYLKRYAGDFGGSASADRSTLPAAHLHLVN
jgi:hypothetical protein